MKEENIREKCRICGTHFANYIFCVNLNLILIKANPSERWGRKATGLKFNYDSRVAMFIKTVAELSRFFVIHFQIVSPISLER